jgi:uncharacterized membrane protein
VKYGRGSTVQAMDANKYLVHASLIILLQQKIEVNKFTYIGIFLAIAGTLLIVIKRNKI